MEVITRQQALARGITDRQLSGRGFQQLFHGTWCVGMGSPEVREWVAAAQLVLPTDCRPAGRTAFQLRGVAVGPVLPVVFAAPQGLRVRRDGLRVLKRVAWPGDMGDVWNEVCRTEPLVDAIALGDQALRVGVLRADHLGTVRGRQAAIATQLLRVGAESWRESWLRLCLVLAGLPEPEPQVDVYDSRGRWLARVDLLYRDERIVVEYDGEQHRLDDRQYRRDIERLEGLVNEGYLVIRVTKADVPNPWGVVQRVSAALRSRGCATRPRRTALWRSTVSPRTS